MKRMMSAAPVLALGALTLAVLAGVRTVAMPRFGAAEPGQASFRGHQFADHARLSLGEARRTALKARPGALVDQELEKEPGGSGLRYSFDLLSDGKIYEVGVDARTGKILENDVESAAEGAAER